MDIVVLIFVFESCRRLLLRDAISTHLTEADRILTECLRQYFGRMTINWIVGSNSKHIEKVITGTRCIPILNVLPQQT